MSIEKIISPFIESQFPSFYKSDGPNFIAFVKAYYEWLEQEGNVTWYSRSLLDNGDIDNTLAKFIIYFKNKYINNLPENIVADKKLLIKHITDLYNSKGTENSYKLLFRMIFNEDIELYTPGDFILKPSDGKWVAPKYIEVSDYPEMQLLVGNPIRSTSGAEAVVDNYVKKKVNGKLINILFLSNILGEFKFGDKVYSPGIVDLSENSPAIFGSMTSVNIVNGGYGYNVGDRLVAHGEGMEAVATVASVSDLNGRVKFNLIEGGFGFTVNSIISVVGGGGTGATFKIGAIADKQVVSIYTDTIPINTHMDIETSSYDIGITGNTNAFNPNEVVTFSANSLILDTHMPGNSTIYAGESLTNTALGITGPNALYVYRADGNLLFTTGSEEALNSSNLYNKDLHTGATLVSNITGISVTVLNRHNKDTVTANGTINTAASNSTSLHVYSTNPATWTYQPNTSAPATATYGTGQYPVGFFFSTGTLTGVTSLTTAQVTSVTRDTDWNPDGGVFPAALGQVNLDTRLVDALRVVTLEIGRIAYINGINPGSGYASSPVVTITEPLIYDQKIPDGKGGYWGYDAKVTSTAGTANGVVRTINIKNSGYGFRRDEYITLSSNTNTVAVYGIAGVDLTGKSEGYYRNNSGFSSDNIYIQDSEYYQNYSYEISAERMIDTYITFVEDLVHPSGVALYGKYAIRSTLDEQLSIPVYFELSN
jgi:hypothetical protein